MRDNRKSARKHVHARTKEKQTYFYSSNDKQMHSYEHKRAHG